MPTGPPRRGGWVDGWQGLTRVTKIATDEYRERGSGIVAVYSQRARVLAVTGGEMIASGIKSAEVQEYFEVWLAKRMRRRGRRSRSMMSDAEFRANRDVRFLPMTWREPEAILTDPVTGGPAPYDPDGGAIEGHPCMEVGGVQVYAYLEGGRLIVSLHYDEADPAIATGEAESVPTEIKIAGRSVWTEDPIPAFDETEPELARQWQP